MFQMVEVAQSLTPAKSKMLLLSLWLFSYTIESSGGYWILKLSSHAKLKEIEVRNIIQANGGAVVLKLCFLSL